MLIFIFRLLKKMLIVNPIYDVVFKYLIEDSKVAKLLLSSIIGQQISGLNLKPLVKVDTVPIDLDSGEENS